MGLGNNDLGITLGTSGVVFKLINEYKIPENKSLHLFCHAEKNKWHLMGVTQSGALSLKWINNILNLSFDDSMAMAKDSNPGSNGVLFFPYLNGERSPFNSDTVRGSFIGLKSSNNRNDIIRSVMEGIAFNLRHVFMEMHENANRIIISGGGSKSDLLLQIISDVFNKKVYLSNKNSSAYGASLIGLNNHANYDCIKIFEPSNDSTTYQDLFEKYLKLSYNIRKM